MSVQPIWQPKQSKRLTGSSENSESASDSENNFFLCPFCVTICAKTIRIVIFHPRGGSGVPVIVAISVVGVVTGVCPANYHPFSCWLTLSSNVMESFFLVKTSPPPPLLSSFMEVSLKQIICGKKKNERWHCQEILSSAAGPLCAVILLFFYYCYNLHWIFTVKCPCKFFQKTNILRTELNGLTRLLSPPCFFCLRKVLIYPSFMANKS